MEKICTFLCARLAIKVRLIKNCLNFTVPILGKDLNLFKIQVNDSASALGEISLLSHTRANT